MRSKPSPKTILIPISTASMQNLPLPALLNVIIPKTNMLSTKLNIPYAASIMLKSTHRQFLALVKSVVLKSHPRLSILAVLVHQTSAKVKILILRIPVFMVKSMSSISPQKIIHCNTLLIATLLTRLGSEELKLKMPRLALSAFAPNGPALETMVLHYTNTVPKLIFMAITMIAGGITLVCGRIISVACHSSAAI